MAGKKNPNLGDKLRQEREGAENTLRDSRSKTADSSTGDGGKKKAEHRRQIRHEADLAKMRSKKLKSVWSFVTCGNLLVNMSRL